MTECIQEAESGGGAQTDALKQSGGRVAQEASWELQVWRDVAMKWTGVREDRKEALKQQSSQRPGRLRSHIPSGFGQQISPSLDPRPAL